MREGRLERAVLEGTRVLLQPVRGVDAAELFPQIHAREPVLRWLIWPGPESVGELARRFADWHVLDREQAHYVFAVRDRESRALAGTIGVRLARDGAPGNAPGAAGEADLGYWLGEAHWGRGFATEAIGLVSWLAFTHLAVERVVATVFVGNTGSRIVLERNGFRLEETLRDVHIGVGRTVDEWLFVLERRDWEPEAREPRREEVVFGRP